MSEPVYIKVFLDDLDALEQLEYSERGRLLTALLEYGRTGVAPQLKGNERFVFPIFKGRIDRDFAAWRMKEDSLHDVRAEAGRKGGQTRANKGKQSQANQANQSKGKQIKQGQANQAYDKDNDNDNDNNKDNDGNNDNDDRRPPLPPAGASSESVSMSASDSAISRVLSAYLSYCPGASEESKGLIAYYCCALSPEVCLMAINVARDAGHHDWAYLQGILHNREEAGIRTIADWNRHERERKQRRNKPGGVPAPPAQNAGTPEQSADERWGVRSTLLDGG